MIVSSLHAQYSLTISSVWPGLAAMALMIPVPGYVAKLLRGAQVEKDSGVAALNVAARASYRRCSRCGQADG